ncbi:OmpP1/FadL family transporter [Rhizobium leguminosarum]|jgi:long-chain fatty acid transport protein|uniref:Transporter n=1 Tax=Rhizobium leguminosarum TaxID=384 RepID=A0A6P0DJX5_RHILE|nr:MULTISPECIES: OmpP1/FadL family transporter [Rhizobium]ASS53190.1 transporter [Rhizobium leguminosarum bv. viciae]AVC49576.1 outer membrane transport family protein [Rhizobium leguminosarum bv. viciae]MBA8831519.1 long-chain fatty acid transport protein [Rhizobium leguminosarum]MBA9035061.1 long-chain fatty acid transport protein [Rhizobium leguminosarum]MBB4332533.1 long-chain fatty acid transport protein [Rhizobium leguminosarum]
MASRRFSKGITSLVLLSSLASPSFAGGLERGGYNIDLLFDNSRFAVQSGATYVMPQRKLKNVKDTDPTDGLGTNGIGGGSTTADDTEDYWIPYLGVKVGFGDSIDCMGDFSTPFGAHTNPGADWLGVNDNIETKISTRNYGATCSYRFDMGPGQLRLIGGGFYQTVDGFKTRLVAPITGAAALVYDGTGRLDLADQAMGWRAGIAYEIEEYAFRASLVYNSKVKYDDLTGTVDLTEVPKAANPANPYLGVVTPVYGSAEAPDSVELKLQSGIAPDWLAFGSVKWTNWSVLQSIAFCPKATKGVVACSASSQLTSLDLFYRDGWTISGGVGHKFNEQWAGALSLTWDRGTSQGYGAQTDTWTLGAGVSYTPVENVEWRLAGALGIMTGGESGTYVYNGRTYGNDVSYSFGDDLLAALSTSVKVKF